MAQSAFRVGDLVVDLRRRSVSRSGAPIELPRLSFDFLAALVESAPGVISHNELFAKVWPGLVVGPETISQRAKLVRAALGDDSAAPTYIEAVRGIGYRLRPAVEPFADAHSPLESEPEHKGPSRMTRTRWALVLSMAAAVVLTASLLAFREQSAREASTEGTLAAERRLAVLPFENLSADGENAYLADGLHLDVIVALSHALTEFVVVPRTTMLSYRAPEEQRTAAIVEEIGATEILSGALRSENGHLQLTLQLIDTATDRVVWSKSYEREADFVDLRAQVASDVVAKLMSEPSERTEAALTRDSRAYDLYLRALLVRERAATNFGSEAAIREMVELLDEALAIDPEFVVAYAERAAANIASFQRAVDPSEERLRSARNDVETALFLDPRNPNALAARGMLLAYGETDVEGAITSFEAAAEAGLADSIWRQVYAEVLISAGRSAEAKELIRRTLVNDPKNILLVPDYAGLQVRDGELQEAWRTLGYGLIPSQDLPLLRALRALLAFNFAGDASAWERFVAQQGFASGTARGSDVDSGEALIRQIRFLRWTGRADEVLAAIDRFPGNVLRGEFGIEPLALQRGWAQLIAGDRAAAAESGRAILAFLESRKETRHNIAARRLLEAEAHLFMGDLAAARRAADAAAEKIRPAQLPLRLVATYAWSGAEDEAVGLLEELMDSYAGFLVGPAALTRDPILALPLAANARYQTFAGKLSSRMRSTRFPEN